MCWRDNVRAKRHCSICGNNYYGDLGHRGCPGFKKAPTTTAVVPERKEKGKKKFIPTDEVPF